MPYKQSTAQHATYQSNAPLRCARSCYTDYTTFDAGLVGTSTVLGCGLASYVWVSWVGIDHSGLGGGFHGRTSIAPHAPGSQQGFASVCKQSIPGMAPRGIQKHQDFKLETIGFFSKHETSAHGGLSSYTLVCINLMSPQHKGVICSVQSIAGGHAQTRTRGVSNMPIQTPKWVKVHWYQGCNQDMYVWGINQKTVPRKPSAKPQLVSQPQSPHWLVFCEHSARVLRQGALQR